MGRAEIVKELAAAFRGWEHSTTDAGEFASAIVHAVERVRDATPEQPAGEGLDGHAPGHHPLEEAIGRGKPTPPPVFDHEAQTRRGQTLREAKRLLKLWRPVEGSWEKLREDTDAFLGRADVETKAMGEMAGELDLAAKQHHANGNFGLANWLDKQVERLTAAADSERSEEGKNASG